MANSSLEATIDFLLSCLECNPGKPDWEAIAQKSGWYKRGKFSQQAFRGIEKKYKGTVISQGDNATATPTAKRKTPAKSAKRGSEAIEDDEDTPSGKKAKVEHDGDETPSKPEKTTKKVDAPIKHERD